METTETITNMKVVINKCYGGFGISQEAAEFMAARGNKRAIKELEEFHENRNGYDRWYGYGYVDAPDWNGGYERTDPDLVAAVENLGTRANGEHAELKVVEIPDGIEYEIDEYDGIESIHEAHESWG